MTGTSLVGKGTLRDCSSMRDENDMMTESKPWSWMDVLRNATGTKLEWTLQGKIYGKALSYSCKVSLNFLIVFKFSKFVSKWQQNQSR